MEHIRQAVERRRALNAAVEILPAAHPAQAPSGVRPPVVSTDKSVQLDRSHLESRRIVAHDVTDARSKSFDILRTQILHIMDKKSARFLAVTSPTPGCGKTVTAVNLALSIARQTDRSVLLVDFDLQKPNVAATLGLKPERGLLSVLAGEAPLADALAEATIGKYRITVLPTEAATQNSSEWMTSRPMSALLDQIRTNHPSSIVIFDLPPILPSDDVISILPFMDGVLFVTAIGTTTLSEVRECNKHLDASDVLRVVVNKAPEKTSIYYY